MSTTRMFLDICDRAVWSSFLSSRKYSKPGEFYMSLPENVRDRLKSLTAADTQALHRSVAWQRPDAQRSTVFKLGATP